MSDHEVAGHPPAEKVGGVRVKQPRKSSKSTHDEEEVGAPTPTGVSGSLAKGTEVEVEGAIVYEGNHKNTKDTKANPSTYHPPPTKNNNQNHNHKQNMPIQQPR
eukprot:TRINITY_DN1140_c0_g1_i2.p1 TRINITY_DN1140_c0_g1~~TRINITY_DN1140_c0_g1_i2.p1  ORF type:complete len:104 (-),score=34.24 TRINITY_DN1140_c0_g1_i2:106-417(-)